MSRSVARSLARKMLGPVLARSRRPLASRSERRKKKIWRVLFMSQMLITGGDIVASLVWITVVVVISSKTKPGSSGNFPGARHGPHLWAALGALVVMFAGGSRLYEPKKGTKGAAGAILVPALGPPTTLSTMDRSSDWKSRPFNIPPRLGTELAPSRRNV